MECTNDTHLALINSTYKIPTTIKKCDNVVLSKMGPRIIQVGPYPMKWEFENGETTQETSANQKTSEPCLKPLRDSSHLIREYGNEESRKLAQKLLFFPDSLIITHLTSLPLKRDHCISLKCISFKSLRYCDQHEL